MSEVRSTAVLLLELYGEDVVFDDTEAIDAFRSGS
jgi:hypothetical protein